MSLLDGDLHGLVQHSGLPVLTGADRLSFTEPLHLSSDIFPVIQFIPIHSSTVPSSPSDW